MGVLLDFSVLSNHGRVLDDAVVARWNDDHLLGTENHLLIVLANECLRADFKLCHIAVLIQDVDVVVRWDPIDAL